MRDARKRRLWLWLWWAWASQEPTSNTNTTTTNGYTQTNTPTRTNNTPTLATQTAPRQIPPQARQSEYYQLPAMCDRSGGKASPDGAPTPGIPLRLVSEDASEASTSVGDAVAARRPASQPRQATNRLDRSGGAPPPGITQTRRCCQRVIEQYRRWCCTHLRLSRVKA